MAFDSHTKYAPYIASGCDDCGSSAPSAPQSSNPCEECGCCPPGLVELKDANGDVIGCVTPNDAQEYMSTTYKCPDGYIRLVDSTGNFQGCISVADYMILNP
jgi:hypothetical protein